MKKTILSAAILGAAVALPAQADVGAYAFAELDDFQIQNSAGVAYDWVADFAAISFTGSSDISGGINTTSESDGFNLIGGGTSGSNLPSTCVGSGCGTFADNTLPFVTGAQGLNYAQADQFELESPLSNTPNFDPAAGAEVGNSAYATLTAPSDGIASGNSNNELSASWQFVLNSADSLTFDALYRAYVEAYASADEAVPASAAAALSFEIEIEELDANGSPVATIWTLATDEPLINSRLNRSVSVTVNAITQGNELQQCAYALSEVCGLGDPVFIPISITTPVLLAGTNYQLSLRQNANADVLRTQPVPEPAVLGLLGLGLLGLAGTRRRRG